MLINFLHVLLNMHGIFIKNEKTAFLRVFLHKMQFCCLPETEREIDCVGTKMFEYPSVEYAYNNR